MTWMSSSTCNRSSCYILNTTTITTIVVEVILLYLMAFGPIPSPCLGCGSEAFWVFVGISWCASRGLLGSSFEASWGPFWGLFWASWVPLSGLFGVSSGLLGASWGPLGASWGLLGAEGLKCQLGSPVWAPFWRRLRGLWGRQALTPYDPETRTPERPQTARPC